MPRAARIVAGSAAACQRAGDAAQWLRRIAAAGGGAGGRDHGGGVRASYWRGSLWLAMLAAVLWVGWQSRWSLFPFAVGALFAYVLTPLVDRIASLAPAHTHRADVLRRGVAVLVVYGGILLVCAGLGFAVVPLAVDQGTEFVDGFPELRQRAQDQANEWLEVYRERVPADARARIDGFIADTGDQITATLAARTRGLFASLTGTIGVIFGFLIVPIWLFYALRDRHSFERNFRAALPDAVRSDILNGVRIADALLGRYLRGQLFLGLVVGLLIFVGLTALNVELSIALAIFAGITELIPIIGPWIGALPALLVVAASGDPEKLVWVALLYLLVQQLENNLLVPRIQSHAVDLHPAVIILLLTIAGAVFGFIGLLVIVPLTALLRELFWYADHRLRGLAPREALLRTHVARRLVLDPPPAPPPAAPAAPPAPAPSGGGGAAREGGEGAG